VQKGNLPRFLLIYFSFIIIILAQMDKNPLQKGNLPRFFKNFLIIILAQMDKNPLQKGNLPRFFLKILIIILAQMDKIHCRKDTFQDFQQHTLNMSDLVPGASSSPKRV